MYYYNKKSRKKIVHTINCFHICTTNICDIGWFETLPEAFDQNFRFCKHCNPLYKFYKNEVDKIIEFCRINGLAVNFYNKYIFVDSIKSKWKIALDKDNKIILYHKNNFKKTKDTFGAFSGFHLQKNVKKDSIIAYLRYIIEHDNYRLSNPIYVPKKKTTPPPRKGTKRYKDIQKKTKNHNKRKAIKKVLDTIESFNTVLTHTTIID